MYFAVLDLRNIWIILNFLLQEGFAFAHCTTCKAPYHLRVHVAADRKWRTLKFRFFVTRDMLFIFLSVQLVGDLFPLILPSIYLSICTLWMHIDDLIYPLNCLYMQVIASLSYLVYLIDGYQQYWLRLLWGFDSEMSFYYICGKLC